MLKICTLRWVRQPDSTTASAPTSCRRCLHLLPLFRRVGLLRESMQLCDFRLELLVDCDELQISLRLPKR